MQLKITTDYAIRCVLFLALVDRNCSAQEIGEAMSVPPKYAQHILRQLRIAGIVRSSRGGCGGYELAKLPKEISMLEIIVAMEKKVRINRCLENDGFCNRHGVQKNCQVHAFYERLQTSITEELTNTTIWDLLPASKK